MSHKINIYYIIEWHDGNGWYFEEVSQTLSDACRNRCGENCAERIVRYAPKRLPEIVRQWDAEGKRVV